MMFWIILGILMFSEIVLIGQEWVKSASVLLFISGVIGLFFWHHEIVDFIFNHYILVISMFPMYIFAGCIYARIRWRFWLGEKRGELRDAVDTFKEKRERKIAALIAERDDYTHRLENKETLHTTNSFSNRFVNYETDLRNRIEKLNMEIKEKQDNEQSDWIDYADNNGLTITAPRVSHNKARIMTWIGYWPASFAWFLLNDPIIAISRKIYYGMARQMQNTSDKMFADAKDAYKNK